MDLYARGQQAALIKLGFSKAASRRMHDERWHAVNQAKAKGTGAGGVRSQAGGANMERLIRIMEDVNKRQDVGERFIRHYTSKGQPVPSDIWMPFPDGSYAAMDVAYNSANNTVRIYPRTIRDASYRKRPTSVEAPPINSFRKWMTKVPGQTTRAKKVKPLKQVRQQHKLRQPQMHDIAKLQDMTDPGRLSPSFRLPPTTGGMSPSEELGVSPKQIKKVLKRMVPLLSRGHKIAAFFPPGLITPVPY